MSLSRRRFIKTSLLASGALSLGFSLTGCGGNKPYPNRNNTDLQPNAFIQVTPNGQIILQVNKVEMGQGTLTGFSTLVAEELDIEPKLIKTELSGIHKEFADPQMSLQVTGGSTSMKVSFLPVREAAATVREILRQAAAQQMGWPLESITIIDAKALNTSTSQSVDIGELVATATTLAIPENITLKPEQDFKYIGSYDARVDAQSKVDGSADFCIDLEVPDALIAVVVRSPHHRGKPTQFEKKTALGMPGVKAVFTIESGIAVVADSYWQARKAAQTLNPRWQANALSTVNSASIIEQQRTMLTEGDQNEITQVGDYSSLTAGTTIEREYRVPYLAHATMEPLNAIASVTDERIDLWAGNQGPDIARSVVASTLNRPREQIHVHTTLMGGGFGRRIVPDFIAEAASISANIKAPIKLIWSREDDIQNDYYRPAMMSKMSASFNETGELQGWRNHIVGPSLSAKLIPVFGAASMPEWVPHAIPKSIGKLMASSDFSSVEGADNLPYQIDNINVVYTPFDPGLPIGYWRSVGHSQNGFFVESFVDEIAHQLNQDPVEFRRQRLKGNERHLRVLELAVEKGQWGTSQPGRFQGVAIHESFGSVVAEIVELSIDQGKPVIHKVTCAIDCGRVVNPDIVTMQMESGIIFGLTAALKGEITLKDGAVEQSNFHDYPLLRIDETPEIEVHVVSSNNPPEGVGEPGVPPIAPAVGNAIFAATGQRLRSLPFRLGSSG